MRRIILGVAAERTTMKKNLLVLAIVAGYCLVTAGGTTSNLCQLTEQELFNRYKAEVAETIQNLGTNLTMQTVERIERLEYEIGCSRCDARRNPETRMKDSDFQFMLVRIKILAALHRAIDWNAPYDFLDKMPPLRYKGKPFSQALPEMIEDPEEREAYEKILRDFKEENRKRMHRYYFRRRFDRYLGIVRMSLTNLKDDKPDKYRAAVKFIEANVKDESLKRSIYKRYTIPIVIPSKDKEK